MLVLSRRVGSSLRIDGGIKIYVLGTKGNQVKLGIEAPKDVVVLRTELDDRRKK
jgi:carbon storage regulator